MNNIATQSDPVLLSTPLLLTVEQTAHMLQISRTATYELLRTGELPRLHLGNRTRIPTRAVEIYIDNLILEQAS